ncbi:MAG: TIR domain-containing protein, partial [Moorea sp. SIO4A1]|uniref:nSTAND1 domain-containing NTPase n=1 Tax=Moorena sp. SIO4A1 TaxID=2607835 RepID=UPI00144D759F
MAELSTYDIFISYTDDDSEWVEGFLIPALGVPEQRIITREKFRPGADKVVEFERAVTSSCYVLLILSPAFLNDIWVGFGELIASYSRVVQQRDRRSRAKGDRILPLIRESCELPLRLDSLIPCDCTDEAACEHAIVYLRELLAQPEPKLEPIPCPYPGMKPFTPEDSRFFYGREPEIKNLLLHLRKQNYFFVIGPSGSGKSSLVLAGLVAQLEKRQPGQWLVKSIRPGTNPMQALAEALGISGFSIVDNFPTVEQYREWVDSLLVGTQPGCRLFLFIDQFEELFSQSNKQDQTTLIAAIQSLRQVEHCTLVVAMRADFYPDLMDSNLWPLQGFERIEIAPLHGKRLEEAIAKPAENCGVYIEAKLLERLVNDAADEPGVLPLIQETMVLLWDTMEPRLLTLSAYEKLGQEASKLHPSGLSVAIATHADATLAKLSESQQAIARRVFLRLVQFGEGRPDTRRQQPIDQLITIDDELNLFNQTLQHLADSRLLTLSGEKNSSKKVDIAHEALIRAWQTLQQWITQRREAEQTRRRLEEKVKEWLRLGGSGGLLDQVELAEAQRWLKSADANALGYNQELLNLVDVSNYQIQAAKRQEEKLRQQALAQERKARQAAQTRTIVVSIALVIVTGLGVFGFNQSRNYRMKSLEEMRTSSLLLLSSNQELDALVKAVEAGELLKNT